MHGRRGDFFASVAEPSSSQFADADTDGLMASNNAGVLVAFRWKPQLGEYGALPPALSCLPTDVSVSTSTHTHSVRIAQKHDF
jgi:hypothetical protein